MNTWGIIPAGGHGSGIRPLAFSKELLPIGSRCEEDVERPRAVSEYLVERMIAGGANKLCFVIAGGKSDILEYYGGRIGDVDVAYVVQPRPAGVCDALFRAAAVVGEQEQVLIGLPDTIWFPADGFAMLPADRLAFLLFCVERGQAGEAVVTDDHDGIREFQVRQPQAASSWIWGAGRMPGTTFHALHSLWRQPGRRDEYLGSLVNAYLGQGHQAIGLRAGLGYVDVGTMAGYREAIRLLNGFERAPAQVSNPAVTGYTDGWRPLTAAHYAHAFPQQRVEVDALHRSNR